MSEAITTGMSYLNKKASPPIDQKENWLFRPFESADSYLEGAAAGAFSLLDFVEELVDFFDFFDFLGFSVLEVYFVVDLSSDANVPELMVRANIAMMINDSNFFIGLSPCF